MMRVLQRFPCVVVMSDDGKVEYLHRFYILKSRLLSIYVHKITANEDEDMHDHPWPFLIVILKQGYREVMPHRTVVRRPGAVFGHLPSLTHRIELVDGRPSWSLVVMGPKVREWGFHTKDGWVHFKQYMKKKFRRCE